MFAMKEYCVVTTPHWAFHPPAQWFDNFLIQISYLKSLCTPWSLLVTGDQLSQLSTEQWSGGLMSGSPSSSLCHAPELPLVDVTQLMMEWRSYTELRMHGYCRGQSRASLIMFYRVTSQLGLHLFSGLVIRHCPSPLLSLQTQSNHRLRFPVKNQLNNLPIGIG